MHNLILRLEHDSVLAIEWLECDCMKLNQDQCHLLISRHIHESVLANIGSCKIWKSNDQKILGVNIDHNLKFSHCILKQRTFKTVFFFGILSLSMDVCDKTSDNRINHLHERALRMVYNDNVSIFEKTYRKR